MFGIGSATLYTNSLYLFFNTALSSLLGFAFWTLAVRFYSTAEIGLNSAIISIAGYLALIATAGMRFALIRYYPEVERKHVFTNTYLVVATVLGLVVTSIFVVGIGTWAPILSSWNRNVWFIVLLVVFVVLNATSPIMEAALIVNRAAKYVLAKNVVFGVLKIGLIVIAGVVASLSIMATWCIALLVSVVLAVWWFMPRAIERYRLALHLDMGLLRETIGYSGSNHIVALLASAPILLVPLLVVNVLGAEANAYFYISWMIANLLFSIPASMSYILFSEGSANDREMRTNIVRNYKMCFALLVPGIAIVFLLGQWILGIFGTEYAANAVPLLRILAVSVLPLVVVDTQTAIYRVRKQMGKLIMAWGIIAGVTLAGGYMLMPMYGILGIGYAWMGANLVVLPMLFIGGKHESTVDTN